MFRVLFKLLMKMFFTVKKWPRSDFTKDGHPSFYFLMQSFSPCLFKSTSIKQSSVDTLKMKGYFSRELRKLFQKNCRLNTVLMNEKFVGYVREEGFRPQASQAESSSVRSNRRWSFWDDEFRKWVHECRWGQEGFFLFLFLLFRNWRRSLLDDRRNFWATHQRNWFEWIICNTL